MKVGIFLTNFDDIAINKDPGQIATGLINNGINLTILANNFSSQISKKFKIQQINKQQYNKISYWKNSKIEVIIIYSWLSLRYMHMIKAAKLAGLKIILKLDSDGYLIYPLTPSYLKVFGLNKKIFSKIIHILRVAQWKFLAKTFSRYRIKQIELCNAAIIETPIAKKNIDYSLSYWNKNNLIKKIVVIPNPINGWPLNINTKKNTITCIGRWDDTRKNAKTLIKVLTKLQTNWSVNLIGYGSLHIAKKIKKNNPKLILSTDEQLDHEKIFNKLSETKIFFAPSVSESFNLAAAEALCCGCSLVGGPLPSFQYFYNNNKTGSLSVNFTPESLLETLKIDLKKWDKNIYQPKQIAAYWQNELNLKKISQQIIELIKSL